MSLAPTFIIEPEKTDAFLLGKRPLFVECAILLHSCRRCASAGSGRRGRNAP